MRIFDDLEDFFDDLEHTGPTQKQLEELYHIYLEEFVCNDSFIDGMKIRINNKKSNHRDFRNKHETFVHLITRKSNYSQKRHFCRERANKIHWIKPILENYQSSSIAFFEELDMNRCPTKKFYWLVEKNYIVILKKIGAELLLLTAYCVDSDSGKSFKNKYHKYKEAKKNPTS